MTSETVADVIAECRTFFNDALATHAFARFGLLREHDFLIQIPRHPENPEPKIWLDLRVGGGGEPLSPYANWTLSEALSQVAPDGPIHLRLGHQFVVFLFAGWEHEYRARLASAHGCDPNDLKIPLLGDLRRLRNDILHHDGVATAEQSGKCEVLGHWVTIGEMIVIGPEQCDELWRIFPWSELETAPTSGGDA